MLIITLRLCAVHHAGRLKPVLKLFNLITLQLRAEKQPLGKDQDKTKPRASDTST